MLRKKDGQYISRPDSAFFDRLEKIIAKADSLGLYVILLPTWGDKVTAPWGTGPALFRNDNLPDVKAHGQFLGDRLKPYDNVIWMLGGDRPPRIEEGSDTNDKVMAARNNLGKTIDWTPVWSAMAQGIEAGYGKRALIGYHPQGGARSTSVVLADQALMVCRAVTAGGRDYPVWELVHRDFHLPTAKPTMDLEPNYEDHAYNPWPRWDATTGFYDDYDVRKQVYRSVFAGAAGVTYGHNAVWPFVGSRNDVTNLATMDWVSGVQRPGGRQMGFLRYLMQSRPQTGRIPDDSLVVSDLGQGKSRIVATRDKAGRYAMIYFPQYDQEATVDLMKLNGKTLRAWWFDPRSGVGILIGTVPKEGRYTFRSPPHGPDWVLVLDDADAGFVPPGL